MTDEMKKEQPIASGAAAGSTAPGDYEWVLLEEGTVIEDGDLFLLSCGTALIPTVGKGEVYTSALFQPHFRAKKRPWLCSPCG